MKDYSILKVLGTGAYGKVFLVKKLRNNKMYAMKVIKKSKLRHVKQQERTLTERMILEKV